MKKHRKYIMFGVIALLLAGLVLYLVLQCPTNSRNSLSTPPELDESAVVWDGNQNLRIPHEGGGIAIPGFDSLTFTANTTAQRVNFYNPEDNSCLFLMTLYVGDAQYWQSGYVEPGKGYYDIELSESLSAGEYDAALLVQCYQQSGEALNSARIEFDLTVMEVK